MVLVRALSSMCTKLNTVPGTSAPAAGKKPYFFTFLTLTWRRLHARGGDLVSVADQLPPHSVAWTTHPHSLVRHHVFTFDTAVLTEELSSTSAGALKLLLDTPLPAAAGVKYVTGVKGSRLDGAAGGISWAVLGTGADTAAFGGAA